MTPHEKVTTVLGLTTLGCAMVSCMLFVAFGEITVRRLRKNPETRLALGLDLLSGWDILNVSLALSRPTWIARKLASSPISWLVADQQLLLLHTNRLDRWLGRAHYWTMWLTVVWLAVWFAAEAWL